MLHTQNILKEKCLLNNFVEVQRGTVNSVLNRTSKQQ